MDPRKPMYRLPDFTQRPSSERQPTPFGPMRPIVMRPILPNGAEQYFRPQSSPLPSIQQRTQSQSTGFPTVGSGESSSSDSWHRAAGSRTSSPTRSRSLSYDSNSGRSTGVRTPPPMSSLGTQFPSPSRRSMGTQFPSPNRRTMSLPSEHSPTPPGSPALSSRLSHSQPMEPKIIADNIDRESLSSDEGTTLWRGKRMLSLHPTPPLIPRRSVGPPQQPRTPPGSPPMPSRASPGPPMEPIMNFDDESWILEDDKKSSIGGSSSQSLTPKRTEFWEPPKLVYDPDLPEFRGHGRGQLEHRQVTHIPGDPYWGGWRGWDVWDKVGKKTRKRAFQYNPANPPNRLPDAVATEDPFWTDPTSDRIDRFETSGLHTYWAPKEAEESVYREREPTAFRRAPFPMPTSDTEASSGRKSLGKRLSRFGTRTKRFFSRNRRRGADVGGGSSASRNGQISTENISMKSLNEIQEESPNGSHSRTPSPPPSSLGTQFSSTSGQTQQQQQRSSKGRELVCRCRLTPCLCSCGIE